MKYRIEMEGRTPLVMHSNRCVDPLDELTKEIKSITSKRKKTEADHLQIRRLEFEGGIYHCDEMGPYVPAMNIRKMVIEGGRKSKDGKSFESGFFVVDDVPLQYDGPKDIEGLFEAGFAWTTVVGNQRNSIMRTRPRFDKWSLSFEADCVDQLVSKEMLVVAMGHAETAVGLLDGRSIGMGRFNAKVTALEPANGRVRGALAKA